MVNIYCRAIMPPELPELKIRKSEDEIKAHMDVLYNAERSPCPNNVSIAQYTARIADIMANHNRHLIDHGVGLTGWRLALFYVGQLPRRDLAERIIAWEHAGAAERSLVSTRP